MCWRSLLRLLELTCRGQLSARGDVDTLEGLRPFLCCGVVTGPGIQHSAHHVIVTSTFASLPPGDGLVFAVLLVRCGRESGGAGGVSLMEVQGFKSGLLHESPSRATLHLETLFYFICFILFYHFLI